MTAVVAAVNRSATHSMSKPSVESIELIEGMGVKGDAHMGRAVKHRSRVKRNAEEPNLRQVHLIGSELHEELRDAGFQVSAGQMGENITTRGIDLLGMATGTRLILGNSATIELTGLRDPCSQLDAIQKGLMAATLDKDEHGAVVRKSGVMAIVVMGGVVRPGDPIQVVPPEGPLRPMKPV